MIQKINDVINGLMKASNTFYNSYFSMNYLFLKGSNFFHKRSLVKDLRAISKTDISNIPLEELLAMDSKMVDIFFRFVDYDSDLPKFIYPFLDKFEERLGSVKNSQKP